jgi:hypothetical protein
MLLTPIKPTSSMSYMTPTYTLFKPIPTGPHTHIPTGPHTHIHTYTHTHIHIGGGHLSAQDHHTVLEPNSNSVFLTYLHTTYVSFIHIIPYIGGGHLSAQDHHRQRRTGT